MLVDLQRRQSHCTEEPSSDALPGWGCATIQYPPPASPRRSVCEQAGGQSQVPHPQDWGRDQHSLECVKASLLGWAPAERGAWAAEGSERGCQGGEAQDKLAVVIGQAHEVADISARCWRGPLSDHCHIAGVNSDPVLRDDGPGSRRRHSRTGIWTPWRRACGASAS
jgi:hypothetical protein